MVQMSGMEAPPSVETEYDNMIHSIVDRVDPSVLSGDRLKLAALLKKHRHVLSRNELDLGCTSIVKHRIDTGDHLPCRQAQRQQPITTRQIVDASLEMLAIQTVEPCRRGWASNIVIVKKKDGSARFFVDYRKLNDLTKKDAYSLPRIDSCLDTLSGAKLYSTFDLRWGFHQVAMDPRDADKTAFVCRRGTFRFRKIPFGLCNSSATFRRLMDIVMSGLNFETCLVYLDDIIVFSQTLEQHHERLE